MKELVLPLLFLVSTPAVSAELPPPTHCGPSAVTVDYCVCEPTKAATYDTWTVFRYRKLTDGTSLKDRLSVQFDDISCNQDLLSMPVCNHPPFGG